MGGRVRDALMALEMLCKGDMMRKVLSAAGAVAVVAAIGATVAGCGQIGMLKGKMAFRDANALYGGENWAAAAKRYEEALAAGCVNDQCNPPEIAYAYFFLANSYDNMYRPARKDDPEHQALLKKAAELYQKASEVSPNDEYKKRALQYLVALQKADKLNNPAEAEKIVTRLISIDPNDTTNYYQMSGLYEDASEFEKAEEQLLKAREIKPNDPEVYAQLAGFYRKRGNFDKEIEAWTTRADKTPANPEAQHTIAATYWDKACVPSRENCKNMAPTSEAVKAKYIQAGLEAEDKALAIRADYIDALIYKNLLLRSQAFLEKDVKRQQALLSEATQLQERVAEIRKRQQGEAAAAKKTGEEE